MTDIPSRPKFTGCIVNLMLPRCGEAVDFYRRAFAAEELYRVFDDKLGKLMHSCLSINGGHIFLNDDFPEFGHPAEKPGAFTIHLQVDDVQLWWDRAVAAGCEVTMPLDVQFWGDRYGALRDPWGVSWSMGQTL